MSKHTKKQLIAGLLFISCVISAWLLFITPASDTRTLQSPTEADSLIQLTLSDFNISESQISIRNTRIDSTFSRVTHSVEVPPGFSKTQFHAELQNRLSPYQIYLPARIIFPDKDMQIQLSYRNTIFRTVALRTDEDLKMQRSFASLIITFSGRPETDLLETLTSMGEPIPIAIIVNQPFTVPDWWVEIREKYDRLYIWPKTETGDNLLAAGTKNINRTLEPIAESLPSATLLAFYKQTMPASRLQKSSFSYVNVHNSFTFNEGMSETEFSQAFRRYIEQARLGARPIAIIPGTEEMIKRLQNELSTFKKGGLMITPPAKNEF